MTKPLPVGFNDICSLVTDGTHDSPKLLPEGVPFIKGKHISSGQIDFENCDYISEQDHQLCIKRVKPQADDILMSNIGSIGDTVRVGVDREFSIKNVALLRPDPNKADPLFVFYLMKDKAFKERLLNLRAGAAQQYISLKALRSFRFEIPSDTVLQERIGKVIKGYDDLIENNRRRIALLEESARLLYKEWFVHLRFPGHEHVKVVDGVPEGWERKAIANLGEVVTGKTPSTKVEENYGGDILFVKTPDMHGNTFILNTEQQLTERGSKLQAKKLLPENSILVSCIGTLGVVSITSEPSQFNQQINAIIPAHSHYRAFVYFTMLGIKPRLEGFGGGATMANVNKSKFSSLDIVLPSEALLKEFEKEADVILRQIKCLAAYNLKLAEARDLLLPRLMNGEIDV